MILEVLRFDVHAVLRTSHGIRACQGEPIMPRFRVQEAMQV